MHKIRLQKNAPHYRRLQQQNGQTLLELILTLAITVTLIGIIVPLLLSGVNIFRFVTERKAAFQTNRFAIQRISREIRHIPLADSIKIAKQTSLVFKNQRGERVAIESNKKILRLNKQPLLNNLKKFKLTYFDSKNKALKFPLKKTQKIWRIKFEIVLKQNSHEITLSNEIKPRNF